MKKQANSNRKPNEAAHYYAGPIQLNGIDTPVVFTENELKRAIERAKKQPEEFKEEKGLGIFSLIKRLFTVLTLAMLLPILAGCSHNILTYSDGIGLETTMRPDSGNFGFTFRYGKILNLTARENTAMEMGGSGGADVGETSTASSASSESSVKLKVGPQTTGYDRDIVTALKDHPEAIKAFYEAKNSAKEKSRPEAPKPPETTPEAAETE